MKYNKLITSVVLSAASSAIVVSLLGSAMAEGVNVCKSAAPTLKCSEVVHYQTKEGAKITANYYSLSDGSLDFVKVFLPNGKEITLPSAVSASGERYSDELTYTWWVKGANGFLEQREQGEKGLDWRMVYSDCKEVSGK